VAKLTGKARIDAIEKNQKEMVAECEKDAGYRCTVASYYGGLEFYRIKQLEIRDVRLVHAPPSGVGKFGGDTDNWMWPRHTGDYGFYRAYVSKRRQGRRVLEGQRALQPKHFLKIAKEGVKEGDFIMVAGYPGRTNRHRLPSEVAVHLRLELPGLRESLGRDLAIIERETKNDPAAKLKYAGQVASVNNYYKNRKGMLTSYGQRHPGAQDRRAQRPEGLGQQRRRPQGRIRRRHRAVEKLIAERDANQARVLPGLLDPALPELGAHPVPPGQRAHQAGRRAQVGLPGTRHAAPDIGITGQDRTYDEKVDKALVLNFLKQYSAQPARAQRGLRQRPRHQAGHGRSAI
jgi:hypothetical protein